MSKSKQNIREILKYIPSIDDIVKSLREQNPGLKDSEEKLRSFLRKRLEGLTLLTKQERGVGRTGMKKYYKVSK